jgi:hypothetical protein
VFQKNVRSRLTVTEQVAKIIPYGHSFWFISQRRHMHQRWRSFSRTMKVTITIILILFGQTINVLAQTGSHPPDTCELRYDSVLNRSYYTSVDRMPTFKGGPTNLMKTINKNLKWPGGRCDLEGTVFVACIIETDGRLTNKRILKGLKIGKPCDADSEALKVVDYLTAWVPGQCDGKDVPVQYVIPVEFKMIVD